MDPAADSITLNGLTMSGAIAMGAQQITGLADGVAATDAVTKLQLDSVSAGVFTKLSVAAATNAALPAVVAAGAGVGKTLTAVANGVLTVDGIAVALNDRVLVKDQATASDNGIYTVTTLGTGVVKFVLTRATDADGSPTNEVKGGIRTFVNAGTANSQSAWTLVAGGTVVVDTDSQTFTKSADLITHTAGAGLLLTGSEFNIELDVNPGLEFDAAGAAGQLRAKVDTAAGMAALGAGGIGIGLAANPGLQFTGGALDSKPDTTRGLSKDAAGLFVRIPAANAGLEFVAGEVDAKLLATGGLEKGAGGMNVKIDATPATLAVDATGLKVTGLPLSFKINDVAVDANFTGANASILVNGSNADALHVHAGAGEAQKVENDLAVDSAVAVGDPVYYTATGDRIAKADAATFATTKPVGVARLAQTTVGLTTPVVSSGVAIGVLVGATPGDKFYLGVGGGLVNTRPSVGGHRIFQMGFAKNATDLHVEIQDYGRL